MGEKGEKEGKEKEGEEEEEREEEEVRARGKEGSRNHRLEA